MKSLYGQRTKKQIKRARENRSRNLRNFELMSRLNQEWIVKIQKYEKGALEALKRVRDLKAKCAI